ncbi:MAG: c-type cytochrome [Egibacteraceae bacterium]
MGWLLVAVVAVVFATGALAQESQESQETEGEGEDANVGLGAELYAVNCAQCHGSEGQGGVTQQGQDVPALVGRDEVTLAYIDLVLQTGRMPPNPSAPFDNQYRNVIFDESERAALVAFADQALGIEGRVEPVGEGVAGRGQDVYAANCAACHGATGDGGVAGGGSWTPNVSQYGSETLAQAIRIGPFEMPAFGPDQITDQEVADVAAFLEEVQSEEGTPLGLVELNPVFVSGFVAALAVLLLLSLLFISGTPTWFPDPETSGGDAAMSPADESGELATQDETQTEKQQHAASTDDAQDKT